MSKHTYLASVITTSRPSLESQLDAAVRAGAEIVELRVDAISDASAVENLLAQPRRTPFILTVRPSSEGGQWDGDEAERISLIEKLGLLLPGIVDVEHATWSRSANIRQKIGLVCDSSPPDPQDIGPAVPQPDRPKNKLILSHHDFKETPADLRRIFEGLSASPAHIAKLAFVARDATDALRVLHELRRLADRRDVIALSMGEAGLISRVLAGKFGAYLSFAVLSSDQSSAPGQPTLDEMTGLFRWDSINTQTRVFGVVGWPVAHSRGPHVHNAAMAADGVNGVYLPLPVAPGYEAFARFMDYVALNPWLDFDGLSITLPHKQNALQWLTEHDCHVEESARKTGAVNTVIRREPSPNDDALVAGSYRSWQGDNTDAPAVVDALETAAGFRAAESRGRSVHVLGAGGVARAVVAALAQCAEVTIFNRTFDRGAALARELGCRAGRWADRAAGNPHIFINCTSLGMWPDIDSTPMPADALRTGQIVLDTVYNPPDTRLLREARQHGCVAVSGIEMFLSQAARQYRLWHRREAPAATMRDALCPVISR